MTDAAKLEISSAIKTIRDACDRYDHKGTPQHDPNREPLPERIVIESLDEAIRLLTDLWWSYQLSSGPPGYLIRREQMDAVGDFLGLRGEAIV